MITFKELLTFVVPYLPSVIESVLAAVVLAILKKINTSGTNLKNDSQAVINKITSTISDAKKAIDNASTNIRESRDSTDNVSENIKQTSERINSVSAELANTQTLLSELIKDVKFLKAEARKHETKELSDKEV